MYVVQADIQSYGFDAEACLPDENDETDGVIVPETLCPFDEENLIIFRQNIHAIENEVRWNTQPYLHALSTLRSQINHP